MIYVSNCGKYIAIPCAGSVGYDVLSADGTCIWLGNRYTPTGFKDKDPRYLYPEFLHMVSSYKNFGHKKVNGNEVKIFELGFADHDMSKEIIPYSGNTVTKSYSARFERVAKRLASGFKPRNHKQKKGKKYEKTSR